MAGGLFFFFFFGSALVWLIEGWWRWRGGTQIDLGLEADRLDLSGYDLRFWLVRYVLRFWLVRSVISNLL